ncbi:DUF4386 domain-containing protein [Roseateles cavernae]|uniref:DUF4386 domain-containing protein n=1 Tax=Roseateles cavernae TaxID=3153578 RepID=UPI0032E4D61C
MTPSLERSPQLCLRITGLLYLAIIALGLFGEAVVRGSLVVAGDAAATAARIAAEPLLWRAGIAGDLLMHVLDLPVILALYYLLRPVSRRLALLATWFNLVQTAVLAANKLNLLLPILLLEGSGQAFSAAQLQALTRLAINLHAYGFGIGLIFFGIACLLRGWLIARSGFLPRPLGLLLLLAGLSYLLNSFALLLAPKLAAALFPAILLPAFIGELALALWLIVKGVDLPQWARRRADALA